MCSDSDQQAGKMFVYVYKEKYKIIRIEYSLVTSIRRRVYIGKNIKFKIAERGIDISAMNDINDKNILDG